MIVFTQNRGERMITTTERLRQVLNTMKENQNFFIDEFHKKAYDFMGSYYLPNKQSLGMWLKKQDDVIYIERGTWRKIK